MNTTTQADLYSLIDEKLGLGSVDAFAEEVDEVAVFSRQESRFDTLVWALSHQFRLNADEVVRLYGENWVSHEVENNEPIFNECGGTLQCMDWLVTDMSLISRSSLPGLDRVRMMVIARDASLLRVRVNAPNRFFDFLEGVARGVANYYEDSVRCIRRRVSGQASDIVIKLG